MPYRRSVDTDLEILPPEPDDESVGDESAGAPSPAPEPPRSRTRLGVPLAVATVAAVVAGGMALHYRGDLADLRRKTAESQRQSAAPTNGGIPSGFFTGPGPYLAADVSGFAGHGSLAIAGAGPPSLQVIDGRSGEARTLPAGAGSVYRPAWSSSGEWLSYTTNAQVWVARADGREMRMIDPGDHPPSDPPAWSPVEDVLALTTAGGIQLVPPSGEPARVLPGTRGAASLAWAPDGKSIAFASTSQAGDRVSVVSTSSGDSRPVVSAGAGSGQQVAGWWPDGRGILFWQRQATTAVPTALMSVRLDGGSPTRLTTMLPRRPWLSWSPDRRHFVAVQGTGDRANSGMRLTLCDAPAGTCRLVRTQRGTVALDPAWSPDGTQIIYVQASDAEFIPYNDWVATRQLWTVRSDGSSPKRYDAPLPAPGAPQWSRDGKALLVVGMNDLWLVRADKTLVPVARNMYGPSLPRGYDDGFVDWSNTIAWRS